jgi:hypothetical protein
LLTRFALAFVFLLLGAARGGLASGKVGHGCAQGGGTHVLIPFSFHFRTFKYGKIRSIPLKDHIFRKIPLKDFFFFLRLTRELYSNISARWTVSQKAAEQKARSLVHPALGHIQSARTLCTKMRRVVGCPYYMLNIKRNKRRS